MAVEIKRDRINALVVTVIFLAFSLPANAVNYTFTDLGTLGGNHSFASAINASGQVVGTSGTAGDAVFHATVWNDSTTTDLGTGLVSSRSNDINDSGDIVGWSGGRAMLWSGNTATDLNFGPYGGEGYGINASGQIVGMGYNERYFPALLNDASLTELATPTGYSGSARGINAPGQIVGEIHPDISNGFSQAALWSGTDITVLESLGGYRDGAGKINDLGQIVGQSHIDEMEAHAVLWDEGKVIDLGSLGGNFSAASDINNAGQVVGWSQIPNRGSLFHAVLWEDNKIIDLNNLMDEATVAAGWVLNNANGINENGWIIGEASNDKLGIEFRAYLIKPVPAPSAAWLFSSAMLTVVNMKRRRQKTKVS